MERKGNSIVWQQPHNKEADESNINHQKDRYEMTEKQKMARRR